MELTIKIDKRSGLEVPRYNKDTEKAIKDAKSGKTTKITLQDFRKELFS